MNCTNYKKLKDWQLDRLYEHIRDNQYYLGERAHHNIDWTDAEADFFKEHCSTVASKLRLDFCNNHCSAVDCSLRTMFNDRDSTDH